MYCNYHYVRDVNRNVRVWQICSVQQVQEWFKDTRSPGTCDWILHISVIASCLMKYLSLK